MIGAGNVALDVARMLVLTHDELAVTDIADHALEVARAQRRPRGRRRRPPRPAAGRVHQPRAARARRALGRRRDRRPRRARARRRHRRPGRRHHRAAQRRDPARLRRARRPPGTPRRVVLRFLLSPVELRGEGRVESVVLARNALEAGRRRRAARPRRPTSASRSRPRPCSARSATAARRSPTSRSTSAAALIANEGGRVRRGEYVVGWAKRGPSGVIGTNKKDANDTVDRLLEDLAAGALLEPEPIGDDALEALRPRAPARARRLRGLGPHRPPRAGPRRAARAPARQARRGSRSCSRRTSSAAMSATRRPSTCAPPTRCSAR